MKKRTLNEIRQSKEYQTAKETVGKYEDCTGDVKTGHAAVALQELKGENFYRNPFSHADVDKTVKVIVENLKNEMYDIIFQAVCDEMNQHYVFDSTEYLTEAGLELFEDEWFEFYHTHHGDIIHQVIKEITN
jgi:ATP-dependent helicase/DNAse subunit B